MKSRFAVLALSALAVLALLAACGESPQVVRYERGKYEGKADARPWEGPTFNSEKTAWEQSLRNRVRAQNEYERTE
jgi:uncharacterized lipoprotein